MVTDCSFRTSDGVPPLEACDITDGHATSSKELQSCAMEEGFGSFYAADAFNDHGQTDCMFRIALTTINCESESFAHPLALMETRCPQPFAGFGNETDWMRTFWDLHTDLATDPSMNEILRWIRDANNATAWTKIS